MPKKNILEFTIKEFDEYDKKLKELSKEFNNNKKQINYLIKKFTEPKVPLMYQGDVYQCGLCDYEYKTKNHAGISRTCPSCKSTNVVNVSNNKRIDRYKTRLKEFKEKLKEIEIKEKENRKINKQIQSTKKILDKIKESKTYQNEKKQEAIKIRKRAIAEKKRNIELAKRKERFVKEKKILDLSIICLVFIGIVGFFALLSSVFLTTDEIEFKQGIMEGTNEIMAEFEQGIWFNESVAVTEEQKRIRKLLLDETANDYAMAVYLIDAQNKTYREHADIYGITEKEWKNVYEDLLLMSNKHSTNSNSHYYIALYIYFCAFIYYRYKKVKRKLSN